MTEATPPNLVGTTLSSVPEVADASRDKGPLEIYGGDKPAYPAWAVDAIARAPEVTQFRVAGATIELLIWGKIGQPGVLLLHGNGAHAGWWSFIAPFLAKAGYRVAALSFSGMGGSDWREAYTIDLFAEEVLAACAEAKLADNGQAPVVIAHSFGGVPAIHTALMAPDKVGGLILLDSPIEPPGEEWKGPPKRTAPNRIYATLPDALARFRLAPPQPCENHWALDHIARGSLKQVDGGWTWQFDPFLWNTLSPMILSSRVGALQMPTVVMRGGNSFLMGDRIFNHMKTIFPSRTGFVTIPEAQHHLMLDQPLATIAALESSLAGISILPKTPVRG
jgi:pimeloyl-ACP methyl ester carboxylesterase